MHTIKTFVLATALSALVATNAHAQDMGHDMEKEHGGQIFHPLQRATARTTTNSSAQSVCA